MIQSKWSEIKHLIQSRWGKLTDREIESTRLNLEGLVAIVQKAYGYAIQHAEREYHEFRVSLRPILKPLRHP